MGDDLPPTRVPCAGALPARPGRPRTVSAQKRRALLLDAAETVFIDRGYRTSTMDDVAQQAGMSKKTLYQVFPGKLALFEALLVDRLALLTMPVEEDGLSLEDSLVELLIRQAEFTLAPRQLAMVRVMIAEAPHSPEIGEALKRLEIGRGRGTLERWFEQKTAQGLIDIGDAQENASILFGMVLADAWCSLLLNVAPCPPTAVLRTRAHRGVALLLGQQRAGGKEAAPEPLLRRT